MSKPINAMSVSDRFQAVMNFQPVDRLPVVEWAIWWDKTLDRWYGEGLPTSIRDRYDLYRYFGLDVWCQGWYRALGGEAPEPAHEGAGVISTLDDYEALLPHLYQLGRTVPLDIDELKQWSAWKKQGEAAIWFTLDGFFWFPRTLLGIQEHLYSFYDEPELLHRINQDNAEWMLMMIDRICEHCQPDFMTFAEDLSYNNGPMLSEDQFIEFLKPYYEMVIPKLKEKGVRVLIDSDGNVHQPARWFEEAGIEGILPLERKAGVDMATLRGENPRQVFVGGFDKMTMPEGEAAMREEFERLLPVARKGGYIISCDHQTPPDVSLEHFQTYLTLFREYAQRAAS